MTSSDSSVTRCETCELPMQYDDGHHPPPGSAYEPPCVNCADHPFVPAPAPSTDLASEEPKCPHCGEPYDSDNTCNDYRLHHMPLTPCRDTDSACWRAQQEAFSRYPEHDPAGRSDFLAGALWQRGGYEFGFHKGESR